MLSRARLLLLVAIVVAAVLTTSTYFEVRSFERVLERELVDTAGRAARAVVEDLKSRGAAVDPADVRDTLNELIEANPAVAVAVDLRGGCRERRDCRQHLVGRAR